MYHVRVLEVDFPKISHQRLADAISTAHGHIDSDLKDTTATCASVTAIWSFYKAAADKAGVTNEEIGYQIARE
jgi:hypothetical protein